MSLIHLDKSVLTFHFKEILEDGHLGGPLTLVGLSALILGPKLLSKLAIPSNQVAKPRVKTAYQPHMSLAEWVAHARQQEMSLTDTTEVQAVVSVPENSTAAEKIAA